MGRSDIQTLRDIRQRNNSFWWLLSNYLNNSPCAISSEIMQEMNEDGFLPVEMVYSALLASYCNLNPEENCEDRILNDEYLRIAVKQCKVSDYINNPYYKNIVIPDSTIGTWNFTHTSYKAYEAFVRDDVVLLSDFREIPQIGFFDTEFSFPAVHENGREWMAIKPSEIETMKCAIDAVSGKVVVFGLGLGYFPYMISLKSDVEEIVIVERDTNVIQLCKEFIIPQFPAKEKITIVQSDAFEYLETMGKQDFDYAFVDLWHDVSDGLPLYVRTKKYEKKFPQTQFLYWVENFLLSAVRWNKFEEIVNSSSSIEVICEKLSNKNLADSLR